MKKKFNPFKIEKPKKKKVKKIKKVKNVKKVKKATKVTTYKVLLKDDKGRKKFVVVTAFGFNDAIKKVCAFYNAPQRAITKIVKL